jgi:FkbM family methyltransferase
MDREKEAEALNAKSGAMFDRLIPGFVHAERRPAKRAGWLELTFPCGLSCVTNSNPVEAEIIYNEISVRREYLRKGLPLADSATIVDVGANTGMFSLYLLRTLKNPRIFAIEPVPDTFDALTENMNRYGNGKVMLDNVALGSSEGTTDMVHYLHLTGNSTAHPEIKVPQRAVLARDYSATELAMMYESSMITVPRTTLSALIRENGIGKIDLLKIDTEGCEFEILCGIDGDDWPRIAQVALEVHVAEKNLDPLRTLLESKGFTVVVDEESRDQFGSVNIVAFREEFP